MVTVKEQKPSALLTIVIGCPLIHSRRFVPFHRNAFKKRSSERLRWKNAKNAGDGGWGVPRGNIGTGEGMNERPPEGRNSPTNQPTDRTVQWAI